MIPQLLLTLLACGGPSPAPTGSAEAPSPQVVVDVQGVDVARIAAVARRLRAAPDDQAAILAEAGLTEAELTDALYAIAESAELTKAYEAASR